VKARTGTEEFRIYFYPPKLTVHWCGAAMDT